MDCLRHSVGQTSCFEAQRRTLSAIEVGLGSCAGALRLTTQLLKRDRQHLPALVVRARAFYAQNDQDQAEAHLKEVTQRSGREFLLLIAANSYSTRKFTGRHETVLDYPTL